MALAMKQIERHQTSLSSRIISKKVEDGVICNVIFQSDEDDHCFNDPEQNEQTEAWNEIRRKQSIRGAELQVDNEHELDNKARSGTYDLLAKKKRTDSIDDASERVNNIRSLQLGEED